MKNYLKISLFALLSMLFASLLLFLFGHLSFISEGVFFGYVHLYLNKIWNFAIPLASAFVTLYVCADKHFAFNLLSPLIFSLSTFGYCLPYRYELLMLSGQHFSESAIAGALIYSVTIILNCYLVTLFLIFATMLVLRLSFRLSRTECFVKTDAASPFDLSCPRVFACLIISLFAFIRALISEVISTVEFLAEYFSSITLTEGVTMLFNYVLIILLLVLSHLILVRFSTLREKNI